MQRSEWYDKFHLKNETPAFVAWWDRFYEVQPKAHWNPEETEEYWLRRGFALMGWRGREAVARKTKVNR